MTVRKKAVRVLMLHSLLQNIVLSKIEYNAIFFCEKIYIHTYIIVLKELELSKNACNDSARNSICQFGHTSYDIHQEG